MSRNRLTLAVAALLVLTLVLQLVAFKVRETERAVVKRFGKADREITTPGLYWKLPWPIEEVVKQDARLRVLEGPLEEMTTEDRKAVLVSCFVTWRPGKAVAFLEKHETEAQAAKTLDALLRSTQTQVIGRYPFSALIAPDKTRLRWDEVERDIREPLVAKARDAYAIDVVFVGIRRLALPRDTSENVFARMRSEREARAKELLTEGQTEAQKIKDDAENERQELVNAAEIDAKNLRARAEKECQDAYRVFEQAPDLAVFIKKTDELPRALSGRTTVVFDLSSPPYDVLRGVAPVGSR
jgi:membrane protease subunit HflC